MSYPNTRLRRLRKTSGLRDLLGESRLTVKDFVMPVFVIEGKRQRREIASLPGVFQLSVDLIVEEAERLFNMGLPAILLFGIPQQKAGQEIGGVVAEAVKIIKKQLPELVVITDVCLCSYTESGHCEVDNNDKTNEMLSRIALDHVQAGADIVAPSAMMDGQVGTIRKLLDQNGYTDTGIMSYSVKYDSSFYGPFREAAKCSPQYGDRSSYQMDYRNSNEALRETALDIEEGADIVMVKPALCYLDIIKTIKDKYNMPVAAYNVSGEYSMIKAAVQKGWLAEEKAVREMLYSIRRAGADIIISYYAQEITKFI